MPLAPRARIDDPAKLAADANRTAAARNSFSAPKPVGQLGERPVTYQAPTGLGREAVPPRNLQNPVVGEANPLNPATGLVEPKFNLGANPEGAFGQGMAPLGAGGERLVPFTPPDMTPPTFGTPPVVAEPVAQLPEPVAAPRVGGGFLAAGPRPSAVTPATSTQARFSLADLLGAAGPTTGGLGALVGLGLGSKLVAQNESEIETGLSRQRAATAEQQAGEAQTADITYKGQLGRQAEATATSTMESANRATRQEALGVTGTPETYKTSVIPADIISGTPAQILRAGSLGGSELRPASEGGFPAARGGITPAQQQSLAQTIAQIADFRAANPQFKNMSDEQVATEILRLQGGGQ